MRKFVLALMATAAVVFGFGGVADAGTYPPGGTQVVITDSTPGAGEPVTITVNCIVGETVTFTFNGATITATCVAASGGDALVSAEQTAAGTASATFDAPTGSGTYTGTATGSISGDLGSFTITVAAAQTDTTVAPEVTVPAGGLPATGSSGIGTSAGIAIGLLVVGLGLFAVATVRRRDNSIA